MDPNELLKNPEQVKMLISMLQSLLPEDAKEEAKAKEDNLNTDYRNTAIKPKRSYNKNKKSNKFESMPEFRMHKEDTVIDKKLSKHDPVERTREFEFVDVVCRVCGRKESVSPHLVFDGPARYKCNRCSATSG